MSPDNHLAVVNDYCGLQRAMRARADALQISRATLNEIAGTHDGHAEKLLNDPPAKNLGVVTFGLMLQALGLELVVREDSEQMRKLAGRMVQRSERHVREKPIRASLIRICAAAMGRKGGKARLKSLTPEERSLSARRAGLAGARKRKRGHAD